MVSSHGFFRRTILRNQRFTCRFNKQCVIDKNFRCACRYCRFQKCLSAGMKREAIQFERDTIGSPKKSRRDSPPPIGSTNGVGAMTNMNGERCSDVIDNLMEMEARVNQEMSVRYNSVIASNGTAIDNGASSSNNLGEDPQVDLNEISRTTLLIMVDWSRNLAPFPDLSMEDKIILLKNYAPQHLILMPAFRSPDTTRVCLFNNTYAGRENSAPAELNGFAAFKTSNITPRVLDEIVWPMRQLQMKEEEFVCLKALAFLHPEAKGLSTSSQSLIRDARNKVLKALYSFILQQNPEDAPTRYGNILLLAPALKALTQLLIENMTLTKFFGLAEVDSLLSEFILDDLNDQTSAPVSIKEHLVSGPSFTQASNSLASTIAAQHHPPSSSTPMNSTAHSLLLNNNLSGINTNPTNLLNNNPGLMNNNLAGINLQQQAPNNNSFLSGVVNNPNLLLQQQAQNPFLMNSLQNPMTTSNAVNLGFQQPNSLHGISQSLVDTTTTDTIMTIL